MDLVDVLRACAAQAGQPPPSGGYWRLWRAATTGRLAAQRMNGKWQVSDADLPVAAAILGMAAETKEAAARCASPAWPLLRPSGASARRS